MTALLPLALNKLPGHLERLWSRRVGYCACDLSEQLLGSLRSESVLNAYKESRPVAEIGYMLHTISIFFSRRELGLRLRPVQAENIFYTMKHCFDSLSSSTACSAVQGIHRNPVCLHNCSVILKSNTKQCPDIQEFFLWKATSHKWLLCYSPQLWQRSLRPTVDGESYGRMKKEVNGKCEL